MRSRKKAGQLSGCLLALVCLSLMCPTAGQALEKYGRHLPPIGEVGAEGVARVEEAEEHVIKGYWLAAAFPYNPTFAARPDNTGLVGMRYMLHLETDLYEQYLQFYSDQNFFSDRKTGWIELSEWDGTYALTGSYRNWAWRLQYERDAPLDKSGTKQIYADTLLTYAVAAAIESAWWRARFPNQNLTAYAGAGWLFHNDSYFARPDNTGRALFRYVAHADIDLYRSIELFSFDIRPLFFVDLNMFSDRDSSSKVLPSELDLVTGFAFQYKQAELSVYYESDMPVDRGGLVQRYLALQLRYEFGWVRRAPAQSP